MKFRKWIWGIFFVAAAVLVIMQQAGHFITFGIWPLIITTIMLPVLIESIISVNFAGIFIPGSIILIMFKDTIGLNRLSSWHLIVAAILLSIGFSILFGKHAYKGVRKHCKDGGFKIFGKRAISDEENIDDNHFKCEVAFGSAVKYIQSNNLERASLSCSFGAIEAYFDNVTPCPEGCVINCECSFGSIELYFPREWKVYNRITSSLGSAREVNTADRTSTQCVTLTGSVSFGAVEIRYV